MRGLIITIFLFALISIMFASQTLYNSHLEQNITFDIYNFTENNLVWNNTIVASLEEYYIGEEAIINNIASTFGYDYSHIQSKRISNIIHKLVDFIGYSLFEISKWAMEFGYKHPEYDFGYFMNFVKYWLFAMIAIAIATILVPLSALIYLALVGLNKLFKYAKVRLWQRKKKQNGTKKINRKKNRI